MSLEVKGLNIRSEYRCLSGCTIRFGSQGKALAERMPTHYTISERAVVDPDPVQQMLRMWRIFWSM